MTGDIRLILDEGLPLTTASLLRHRGVDSQHVLEIELAGEPDETILAEAVHRRAVVVC